MTFNGFLKNLAVCSEIRLSEEEAEENKNRKQFTKSNSNR